MSKSNIDYLTHSSKIRVGLAISALLTGCGDADGRGGADEYGDEETAGEDMGEAEGDAADGDGTEGDSEGDSESGPTEGVCGDGVVNTGEDCDDGINDGSHGGCNDDCSLAAFCGDGARNGVDEVCDDGNEDSADGCLLDCSIPASCFDIKDVDPEAADGSYMIDADGEGGEEPVLVYCDLSVLVSEWGEPQQTPGNHGLVTAAAGIAVGDVGGGGGLDMVLFHVEDRLVGSSKGLYRVGWDLDEAGDPTGSWTEHIEIPGGFAEITEGGDIALADVNGNGTPDLVVAHVGERLIGDSVVRYRIGFDLDAFGQVTGGWTDDMEGPSEVGSSTSGSGITLVDLDDNDALEIVMFHMQDGVLEDKGLIQIGWDIASSGEVSVWSPGMEVPDGFSASSRGAGITTVTSPDAAPSLVLFHLSDSLLGNRGYYRVARRINAEGAVSGGWSDSLEIPGSWGSKSNSGGVAAADLGADESLDLAFFDIDDGLTSNPGHYRWAITK